MQSDQLLSLENIVAVLPEITVLCSLLLVLVSDLSGKVSERSLSTIALLGLLGAAMLLSQSSVFSRDSYIHTSKIDALGVTFRAVIAVASALCVLFSTEYVKRSGIRLAEYLALLLSATLGGMFLCAANDLVAIFVSLECLSLPSYLLVGYAKKDARSNEAAIKYLLMGGASSSILAYGLSWLYGLSGGQIQLSRLSHGVAEQLACPLPIWISFACIAVGIGFKLSVVPFHQWAPDVYEGAPTPVAAFLSVGSKTAGLMFATRVLDMAFRPIEHEWHAVLELAALLSMLFGNLIAVTQTSLNRMLAYSSISQAGYLIIGIVSGHPHGYTGMIVYVVVYVFMNLGAFGCVIVFGLRTGTDQIRDYAGLYYRDPWLALSLSVCLLSLGGMPPLAGFFGKLYLFWCGWSSGLYTLVCMGLATSVISVYYYLRVVKTMLTREEGEMSPYVRRYLAPPLSVVPSSGIELGIVLCVLASATIGFAIDLIVASTSQAIFASSAVSQ